MEESVQLQDWTADSVESIALARCIPCIFPETLEEAVIDATVKRVCSKLPHENKNDAPRCFFELRTDIRLKKQTDRHSEQSWGRRVTKLATDRLEKDRGTYEFK
eukprot:TRINITY_DN108096_c0_g1_i1.p1 TRINITY_DN108096_c0_g1~~TRINITY_DN108096_c0_g1_i1.p1  ORF type:complete len:104 (-),score=3.92 TRINITY_DN108096_c0_g1_i1:87-398(-)